MTFIWPIRNDSPHMNWRAGNVHEMVEVSPKTTRDLAWMTQTCTLGYDVMGKRSVIYRTIKKKFDINSVSTWYQVDA